jgi:hypothetical protein
MWVHVCLMLLFDVEGQETNNGLTLLLNECRGDSFNEPNHVGTSGAVVRVHAEPDNTRLGSRIRHIDAQRTLTA